MPDPKRRKRTRWGETDKVPGNTLIGLSTTVPPNLTPMQQQCYLRLSFSLFRMFC